MVFCFLPEFLFCQFFSECGFYIWAFSAVMFFVRCGQCIFVRVRYCQRAAGAESLFKIPLPCRAKPAAGGFPRKMHPHFAWGPGEGRGGGGGILFMNRNSGFFNRLLPSPRPSLAARAVSVPQGEGAYWLFSWFSVSYTSIRKNAVLQDFEQVLRLPLQHMGVGGFPISPQGG